MFGQDDNTHHDSTGLAADSASPYSLGAAPSDDTAAVAASDSTPATAPTVDDTPLDTLPPIAAGSDDLLNIKQEALKQLSPLVGHLNQTPEEKFRTTMMMIQAADDQNLIKDAYAAAQEITDEKTRAQALLDIVNEINYFTSQSQDS